MTTNDGPMLQIGGVPKGTAPDIADAVIRVAQCSTDRDVAVKALDALARLGSADGTTVTNCTFTSGEPRDYGIQVRGSDWEPES